MPLRALSRPQLAGGCGLLTAVSVDHSQTSEVRREGERERERGREGGREGERERERGREGGRERGREGGREREREREREYFSKGAITWPPCIRT